MNRRIFPFFVVALFIQPLEAAFDLHLDSARSAAQGRAFLSSAEDAGGLFTHPAGLSKVAQPELSLMYSKPFTGLPGVSVAHGQAAFAWPTSGGTLGVGFARLQVQNLMHEQTAAVSYSRGLFKRFHAGATVKHLSHAYYPGSSALAQSDPLFQGKTSKSAVALDVGLTASVNRHLEAGVAVRNINEPNVGLVTEDKVRREIQTGLRLDLPGLDVRASGDLLLRHSAVGSLEKPTPFFGLEKGLHRDLLALRAGANPDEFTGGFGLRIGAMAFDYALVFNKNLTRDNAGSHRLGMTWRFNGK
jgi:hypothetical protein